MGRDETDRRLKIVDYLVERVRQHSEGIILGGSVAFGMAHAKSDIDLPIIIKEGCAEKVAYAIGFEQSPTVQALQELDKGNIGGVWASGMVDDVQVDCFLYHPQRIAAHATLESPINIWRKSEPAAETEAYGFDGKKICLRRTSDEAYGGFVYEMPILIQGKHYGHAIRSQFVGDSIFMYERNSFLTKTSSDAWRAVIGQLVKEHGTEVYLGKHNLLNAMHAFHHDKLPNSAIYLIKQRTQIELGAYLSEM